MQQNTIITSIGYKKAIGTLIGILGYPIASKLEE